MNYFDTCTKLPLSRFSRFPQKSVTTGSGCGSVGRVVASDSRGRRFESSHCQKFILNIYCQLYRKDEKKKDAENGPFLKKCYNIDH